MSRQPRAQSRAPGAQSRGSIIPVPEEKPEATEPVSKESLTEEEPTSREPLTPGPEEGKRRDEDRVGSRTPVSPNPG
jgi:hypothetical protein